jgi:ComF family protein
MHSLPETGYHLGKTNPVDELFYGRIPVERAMSLLFFNKESKYRRILHKLKYQGHRDIGIFLGRLIGSRLKESDFRPLPDIIVPVPLHKAKLRRRGFNQSAVIAEGISEILGIPVREDILIRKTFTSTQTRKGRYDRWKNVEGIFSCSKARNIENTHILLVDDVVTTGATLEAAGSCLLSIPGTKLSVATAAYSTT